MKQIEANKRIKVLETLLKCYINLILNHQKIKT